MVAPPDGERGGPLGLLESKVWGKENRWHNASHCGWLTVFRMRYGHPQARTNVVECFCARRRVKKLERTIFAGFTA
jgi:hypothetical protein